MSTLATRLVELRDGTKESLEAVAHACGISTMTLWRYENGKRSNPPMNIINSIAAHYGVTVGYLTGAEEAA